MSATPTLSRASSAVVEPQPCSETAAVLRAVSRMLDGSPSRETIYGAQVILEILADATAGLP